MRRALVTGGRSPLGRAVVSALRASPDFETVRGVEAKPLNPGRKSSAPDRSDPIEDDIDLVPFVPDPRQLAVHLEKEGIDTVIQCDLVPDRNGTRSVASEADVIATMCLGAAIGQEGSPVRSWVLASSSAVYPIGSHSALFHRETQPGPLEEDSIPASIAEAEDYARDVANRLPHVNVSILRLQQIAGKTQRGPLASLLARDPVPTPIGFDPAIQLLHLDDAASAIAFAARVELAGLYNVASSGTIHWDDAVRATGHMRLAVLPVSVAFLEPLLDRVGLPFLPADLFDLLRFGHAIDTAKLERAGWRPQHDQRGCLSALRTT